MSQRKTRTATLFATLALLAAAQAPAAEADPKLEAVREKIGAMFDSIGAEHVNPSPVPGWYTIHKGSIVAYISDDGRYLLQGDLIDLDEQVNLTEQARTDTRRTLIESLGPDEGILFSPAEVKHHVTIFTDVDCTYCRKLHSQIQDYLARGIEVRYMLYPRNGPASAAWGKSEDVWCAKNRNEALTLAKLDRNFETTECDASAVSRQYVLGQEIGLTGTPAIVLDDGTLIAGYVPPDALDFRLQQAAQQSAQ